MISSIFLLFPKIRKLSLHILVIKDPISPNDTVSLRPPFSAFLNSRICSSRRFSRCILVFITLKTLSLLLYFNLNSSTEQVIRESGVKSSWLIFVKNFSFSCASSSDLACSICSSLRASFISSLYRNIRKVIHKIRQIIRKYKQ